MLALAYRVESQNFFIVVESVPAVLLNWRFFLPADFHGELPTLFVLPPTRACSSLWHLLSVDDVILDLKHTFGSGYSAYATTRNETASDVAQNLEARDGGLESAAAHAASGAHNAEQLDAFDEVRMDVEMESIDMDANVDSAGLDAAGDGSEGSAQSGSDGSSAVDAGMASNFVMAGIRHVSRGIQGISAEEEELERSYKLRAQARQSQQQATTVRTAASRIGPLPSSASSSSASAPSARLVSHEFVDWSNWQSLDESGASHDETLSSSQSASSTSGSSSSTSAPAVAKNSFSLFTSQSK